MPKAQYSANNSGCSSPRNQPMTSEKRLMLSLSLVNISTGQVRERCPSPKAWAKAPLQPGQSEPIAEWREGKFPGPCLQQNKASPLSVQSPCEIYISVHYNTTQAVSYAKATEARRLTIGGPSSPRQWRGSYLLQTRIHAAGKKGSSGSTLGWLCVDGTDPGLQVLVF